MSETEPTVEDFLDEAVAQRAKDAGLEPPAKAEDKGKAAKPESGGDAPEAGDEGEDKGEELEASETDGDQDDAADEGEEGDKPKAKPQSRAQKRIRQLTRERDQRKAEAERLKAQNEALVQIAQKQAQQDAAAQQGQPEPQGAQPDDQPPDLESFDGDFVKYNAAMAAWSATQAVKAELAKFDEANRQNVQKAQAQKSAADAGAKVRDYFAKGAEKYEDFAEVQNDYFEATDTMVNAVLQSDAPEDLHYHFAKNPEEAERIAKLSPIAQVREITKLEAKVAKAAPESEPEAEPKPKPVAKKQTSASEPMKPVKAGGAPNKFDPDNCSMDEYMRQYHADRTAGRL